jgi:hypothetical protein
MAAPASSEPPASELPRPVDDAELAMLSSWTKEADLQAVRAHLTATYSAIRATGEDHQYRCVRTLYFLVPRVDRVKGYQALLAAPEGPWLDVGAGLGTDARKLLVDGWPADRLVALDIAPDMWNWGLKLYKDDASPPCKFVVADLTAADGGGPAVAPLEGTCAAVSAMAVLHVLTEAQITALLRRSLELLRPGGSLVGSTAASTTVPRVWMPEAGMSVQRERYLHTKDSLAQLLTSLGYASVEVEEVDIMLSQGERPGALQNMPPRSMENMTHLRFSARRPAAA